MNNLFLRLYLKFENLVSCDEGQDLVEYALVVALIALSAVTSMKALAKAISTTFGGISTTFGNAI